MLNNGPDIPDGDARDGGDISGAPWEGMKDIRLAAAFLSGAGGAMPVKSNGVSWNNDFITTTGHVVVDLLHNFHLECGARLPKLRVYETLSDPTGREFAATFSCRFGPRPCLRRNNRAENSHQPVRRRERIMERFRPARHLQHFVSIHDPITNLFNPPRHDISSTHHRELRATAMQALPLHAA